MNGNYSVNEIKAILYPVFRQYDIDKAVIFGSFAKGTARKNSDLDLLVDSKLHGLKFIGLLEDVRRAINMDVDMLDVSHVVKNSKIEHEILGTGITIYEK